MLLDARIRRQTFLKNPAENIQKAREFYIAKDLAKDSAAPAAAAPCRRRGQDRAKAFTEDDVNAAVKQVVDARSKDGTFVFHDPKLDADLNLVFDQIKIVRGMAGYGWFANVIFHDKDEAKKQYAIDFWFKPEGQELKLMDIRVQKGPKQEGDGWVMITRLPVAWWWLPIQEHPGDMEVTRAWQVMGAIHTYIATHKDQNGALPIKDDKTGDTLPLEFVEIHQPVRHLKKDGRIFCLHRLPQARQPGRILRHRFLGRPEVGQARGRRCEDAQGARPGGRHLDASSPLHLRRYGFRRHQLNAPRQERSPAFCCIRGKLVGFRCACSKPGHSSVD